MSGAAGVVVDAVTTFDDLSDAWERLARAAASPFSAPAWVQPAAEHLEFEARRHQLVVRSADDVVGIAVVLETDGRASFAGSTISDRTGPVCADADRLAVGRAVRRHLDCTLATGTIVSSAASHPADVEAMQASLEATTWCPVARVSAPGYFEGPAARRRRRAVAQSRRFLDEHHAAVVRVETPDDLGRWWDDLARLHQLRFPESTLCVDQRGRTLQTAFSRFAERGELLLRFLVLDDAPVACLAGFRWNGHDWYYLVGRDPDLDLPVGRHLLAWSISDAAEHGQQSFQLLRGNHHYKQWWASERDHVTTCTWTVP